MIFWRVSNGQKLRFIKTSQQVWTSPFLFLFLFLKLKRTTKKKLQLLFRQKSMCWTHAKDKILSHKIVKLSFWLTVCYNFSIYLVYLFFYCCLIQSEINLKKKTSEKKIPQVDLILSTLCFYSLLVLLLSYFLSVITVKQQDWAGLFPVTLPLHTHSHTRRCPHPEQIPVPTSQTPSGHDWVMCAHRHISSQWLCLA